MMQTFYNDFLFKKQKPKSDSKKTYNKKRSLKLQKII